MRLLFKISKQFRHIINIKLQPMSQLNVEVAQQSQSPQDKQQRANDGSFENNNEKQQYSEEEDDEPQEFNKLPNSNVPRQQQQKQKLIQQNIKLKTQIYQLALQLDEILMKDKQKKKKYGLSTMYNNDDDNQAVKAMKLELKGQQLKIIDIKNNIFELKRQLDSVYNNTVVQQKQDKLKQLNRKIQTMQQEKDGLLKIKKGQTKAIKSVKNQEQFRQKIEKVHKEVMKRKQEAQKMMEKAQQAKKKQIAAHENYVIKRNKVRDLESRLAINKEKGNNKNKAKAASQPASKDTISNEMIDELQEQIKKLQIAKKEGEKVWQDKIRVIEGELLARRQEQQKKLLTLRQKQKQYKLYQIRIRELRKVVKQNIMAQNLNSQRKRAQEMDMSQFRHKRNIRYMDK